MKILFRCTRSKQRQWFCRARTWVTFYWSNKQFCPKNSEYKGNSNLTEEILEKDTPLSFFVYLLSSIIIEDIADQTNLFAQQKGDTSFNVTPLEILRYIGICMVTSVIQIPSIRRYWHPILGNATVRGTTGLTRFEHIRQNLHFANSEDDLQKMIQITTVFTK